MIQLKYSYGSDIQEDKEYLIAIEYMYINVSDRSGDDDVERVVLIMIYVKYYTEYHLDDDVEGKIPSGENNKAMELLINKPLQKCTEEPNQYTKEPI